MGGESLTSSHWAKAAGISQHNLDKILCNSRESEERITGCYQRLIASIASSHQGKGLSMQDLIQGSVSELMPGICDAINVLSRQLQRFPTYDEIAEVTHICSSLVRHAVQRNRSTISLDRAMTCRGSMSLQEIIPGPDEMLPEAMAKKTLLKQEIHQLLRLLCDREAHILGLHYGLNGFTSCSFEEIGRLLKLSRGRVRQLSAAALSKLRHTREIQDLNHFV